MHKIQFNLHANSWHFSLCIWQKRNESVFCECLLLSTISHTNGSNQNRTKKCSNRILNINQNVLSEVKRLSWTQTQGIFGKETTPNGIDSDYHSKRKYYWITMKCTHIKVKCNKGTLLTPFIWICLDFYIAPIEPTLQQSLGNDDSLIIMRTRFPVFIS